MQAHAQDGAELGVVLATLGGILLLGLLASMLAKQLKLPRVTLLVLLGLLVGPHTTGLLPLRSLDWFPLIADMTLVLIGFSLGEHLTGRQLRRYGKLVLSAACGESLIVVSTVFTAAYLTGLPASIALLLATIAPATAPAATVSVVEESGAQGPFTETLLEVVAIDDALGLLLFSLALAFAEPLAGAGTDIGVGDLIHGLREIGISILIGVALGLPLAFLSERIRNEELTLAETLGMAFLVAGVALLVGASFLLAAVSMGIVVANIARHAERPFHAVHQIILPFTTVFFVLAGASFEPAGLAAMGVLGAVYVVSRAVGKIAGGALGTRLGGLAPHKARWFGFALLPQAGVALGMALIAADRFPAYRQEIYGVVIGATIIYELFGPIATQFALSRAGELPAAST